MPLTNRRTSGSTRAATRKPGTATEEQRIPSMSPETLSTEPPVPVHQSPWLDVRQAAQHANCGRKSIYNAVASGKLRAARLGGRRELRFLAEWVDAWLIETSKPVVVN